MSADSTETCPTAGPLGAPTHLKPLAPTKSSFFLGLRMLPAEKRLAMYAIYGFCRVVDDIADRGGARAPRLAEIAHWRRAIADLYRGRVPHGLSSLAEAIEAYALRRADFDAILDGMAMDIEDAALFPSRATLDLYIDRVASAPGRLSVRVFGLDEEEGIALSHHLGHALQLTNILRDLDEDARMGRFYLPKETLAAHGLSDLSPDEVLADPRLTPACASLAAEAAAHYRKADRIMDGAPRATVRAPLLMAAAYRPVLDRLVARGWDSPRHPVRKKKTALIAAMLRYGLF